MDDWSTWMSWSYAMNTKTVENPPRHPSSTLWPQLKLESRRHEGRAG